jgi:hypothetical protein
MTNEEGTPKLQTEQEALAELAGISAEDAQILFNDPYSASVIRNNFKVGEQDVDPMEFITGRLGYLKEDHASVQEIEDAMVSHSASTRMGSDDEK